MMTRAFWIVPAALAVGVVLGTISCESTTHSEDVLGITHATTSGGEPGKVDICHIPPGNPANAHTIHVSSSAVPAHLAHGDLLGACEYEPDAGDEGDGGDAGVPDGGSDGGSDGGGPADGGGACVIEYDPCQRSAECCSGLYCSDPSGTECPDPDAGTDCSCQRIIG